MGGFGFSRSQREQDAWDSQVAQTTAQKEEIASTGNGFRQNSRAYRVAIIAYLGIILFGYDTGLGGGVLKLPSFIHDFNITGDSVHVANLSANIVSILQGGAFFGALISAPVSNAMGRKWSLMVFCWIFTLGGALQVGGKDLSYTYAGRFISGFGIGALSAICPTYVSEMAPTSMRGQVSGLFQVLVTVGVALSYWINYGSSLRKATSAQWRIPVGFQLVPVGLMICLIPFIKESPRWLVKKHRNAEALNHLAWVRKRSVDSEMVQIEFAEIVAAVEEEDAAVAGRSWTAELTTKGNPRRFFIAIIMFVCQQWSGQNSINYYAPTIFNSIGIQGTSASLLASGVYGLVKLVATTAFILFGVERAGRKKYLAFGAFGMGVFLFLIGAVFNTHVPDPKAKVVAPASYAMAVLIYLFVVPYCGSWGPLCWVYCSEIFTTRSRAYGLSAASASQWLNNFAVSRATPLMIIAMSKGTIFFFFASINMINVIFSLWIPETRGLSLEQMDIVFGAVTLQERQAEIQRKANILHNEGVGHIEMDETSQTEKEKQQHIELHESRV